MVLAHKWIAVQWNSRSVFYDLAKAQLRLLSDTRLLEKHVFLDIPLHLRPFIDFIKIKE